MRLLHGIIFAIRVCITFGLSTSFALAKPPCTVLEDRSVTEAIRLMTVGPDFNPKKALLLLELAERAGNVDASFNHGLLYMNGWGVSKSDTAAIPFFRKAAECGHTIAQFNLAQILADDSAQVKEAAKWFTIAAAKGHAISAYNLGLMHFKGIGVEKDAAKAKSYFRQAAEAGHVNAMYNLGFMYDDFSGSEVDYSEAFRYYSLAAQRDNPSAQAKLAAFYGLGKGVKKDSKAALFWMRRAAKNGDPEAISALRSLGMR